MAARILWLSAIGLIWLAWAGWQDISAPWQRPLASTALQPQLTALRASDPVRADALAHYLERHDPAGIATRAVLAEHWAQRGDWERLLAQWSALLTLDLRYLETLLPALWALAQTESGAHLLAAYRDQVWWDDLIWRSYRQAPPEVMTALWSQAADASQTWSDLERRAWVEWLWERGDYAAAYTAWVEGLTPTQWRYLGWLYDGAFRDPETPRRLTQDAGFFWRAYGHPHWRAEVQPLGASSVLRLRWQGFQGTFSHLRQRLLLEPGQYRLEGQVRGVSWRAPQGIAWQVGCMDRRRLAQGPVWNTLTVSSEWQTFTLTLRVPTDCPAQVLELRSLPGRVQTPLLDGEIWLRELHLQPVNEESS